MKTKLLILALLPICVFAQPSVKQPATMQSMHDSIVSAHNLLKAPAPQRISPPAAQHSPQVMQWLCDSSYTYSFMSPMDSIPIGKRFYIYDSKGNMTLEAHYTWKSTTNQWINSSKYEYTYDSNGNKTLEIDYTWNSTTNQWVNSSKYEYNYDSNGNKTLGILYTWDNSTNQWIGSSKHQYTYDLKGNKTLDTSYRIINNQWVSAGKIEYTYDSKGMNTTITYYSITYYSSNNFSQLLEELNSKTENTFDSNGNKTMATSYVWKSSSNQWVINSKVEFTYNTNGLNSTSASYVLNTSNNQWLGSGSKYVYLYDINGKLYQLNYITGIQLPIVGII